MFHMLTITCGKHGCVKYHAFDANLLVLYVHNFSIKILNSHIHMQDPTYITFLRFLGQISGCEMLAPWSWLCSLTYKKYSSKQCVIRYGCHLLKKNQMLIDQSTGLPAAHQSITPNYVNLKLKSSLKCVLHFHDQLLST